MNTTTLPNASQIDDINRDMTTATTDTEQRQMQQKLQQKRDDLEFENSMLVERATRVHQMETDIVDINKIMQDLNVLVYQQSEDIGECSTFVLCPLYTC